MQPVRQLTALDREKFPRQTSPKNSPAWCVCDRICANCHSKVFPSMRSNKEIIRLLRQAATLLELHEVNPFQVKAYTSAIYTLERAEGPLYSRSPAELGELGLSKGMAEKVWTLGQDRMPEDLAELLAKTPEGLLAILDIKGLGAKKVLVLWKELGIESVEALRQAAVSGKIADLKGFGIKTQEAILEQIQFKEQQAGRLLLSEAIELSETLADILRQKGIRTEMAGQTRRRMEITDGIELLAVAEDLQHIRQVLRETEGLMQDVQASGPFTWRGYVQPSPDMTVSVLVRLTKPRRFGTDWLLATAAPEHLGAMTSQGSLRLLAQSRDFETEEQIYTAAGWAYVAPELREGNHEIATAAAGQLPKLLEMSDLKGVLHNHSTYSDGKDTLEDMALHARTLGYQYLGITDHSKTAFYANGLSEQRILAQHAEIEQLNARLAPFRIFKGIESDILPDGSLDYAPEVLATFDFVVASIHANLKMDEAKATERLLKAIENPYTTILGHLTGRLLLRREGYPVDHRRIIDACAAHDVIIEINANPWRLDIDWRWVRYALSKGVRLSINPDAHEKAGYQDMQYGVWVGRKGGLTADMTFNTLSAEDMAAYLDARKKQKGIWVVSSD